MQNFTCEYASLDLNYPSFLVLLNMTNTATTTFKKVLTNRADNSSVYHAVISAPQGMEAVAQPTTLAFSGNDSKAEFNMINLEAATVTQQIDYFGNSGFLSWCEVNGRRD